MRIEFTDITLTYVTGFFLLRDARSCVCDVTTFRVLAGTVNTGVYMGSPLVSGEGRDVILTDLAEHIILLVFC